MRIFRLLICLTVLAVMSAGVDTLFAEVTVDPVGLAVSVEAGNDLQTEMTLSNPFDYNISFKIKLHEIDEEMRALNANLMRNLRDLHGPARDRRGDPDDAGYFWVDQNEDDGPDFDWVDIANREGAQRLQLADDWNSGEIELGFEFPWYGEWYPSVRICSNGWFTFDPEQDGVFSNLPEFPSEDEPNNILAVDCFDMTPTNQSSMWFWSDGEGVAVISWLSMAPRLAPVIADITMQAILIAETGTVLYQYGDQRGLPANQVNIGYENQTGELGANILFQQAVVQGTAYAISGPFTKWLLIEPDEGVIPAEDISSLDVTFLTEEMEAGTYEMRVSIELSDAEGERDVNPSVVEISAVMTITDPVADIIGQVTGLANNQPVEGATIALDRYVYARTSDEEGGYSMTDLPLRDYLLTVTAPDYLPMTAEVNIDEAGEYEQSFSLRHSECNPDPREIIREIAPGSEMELSLDIHNAGNGPLTWTVERKLLGDANADPWVLRNSLYVGEEVDDTYIMGAVFDGVNFYVSGSNDNSPVIYILDREGNLQDSFDQPGDDRRGLRDLAYDGNLIWGADSDNIYGFNRVGEVQYTLDAPFSPTSNVTWDPIHQWLWVSTTTTNIIALDLNGDQQAVVDRQGLRVYGLGFYADDPDGYNLYIFAKEPDTDRPYIHKANTDEDDVMFIEYLDTDIGISPSGIFITNEYDIYSYVMVATMNAPGNIGGDRIDIWQVDARKSWMQIDPAEGVIDAGATTEFDVVLDATGLPPEIFEGEFVFTHDGVGGETHVPVTLNVVEGPVEAELTLEFEQGWNMVSVYLQPDEQDVVALMQPLVDEDLLLLMKNGSGNFYSPVDEFCNIPGWFVDEGYLMKVTESCELTLAGWTVQQDEPIELVQGWQTISCYLRDSVDAIVALSGIVDNLVIAKDGWGNFYKPDWEFSNMGDMIWGRGYMVKMTEDTQLIYRLFLEDDELNHVQQRSVYVSPGRLGVHPLTGANMSLALIAGSGFEAFVGETEIGVYASGELVGSGILQGGRCGIAIWGDDPSTPAVDGALAGEALEIRVLDVNGLRAAECVTLAGSPSYETDSFWAVELTRAEAVPAEFGIAAVYPNPFNSRTQVSYGLPEAGHVELSLYDLEGRLVQELVSGAKPAGMHTLTIDGASLSSGVYIVQLRSQGEVSRWKVAMVK